MNIHPTIFLHHKFVSLGREIGPAGALYHLVRLWGFCQCGERGERIGKLAPQQVEALCDWGGKPLKLWGLMLELGWARVEEDGMVVACGWAEHNRQLVSAWANGRLMRERKRGRNEGEAPAWRRLSEGEAPLERRLSEGEAPLERRLSEGEAPLERRLSEGGASTQLTLRSTEGVPVPVPEGVQGGSCNLVEWPTKEEWGLAARMEGLPPHLVESEWLNQERKPPVDRWAKVGRGRLRHHAAWVLGMWRQRGSPGPEGPVAGKNAVARRMGLESQAKALEGVIADHPANPESKNASGEPTAAERADLKRTRKVLEEVRRELAGLGGAS